MEKFLFNVSIACISLTLICSTISQAQMPETDSAYMHQSFMHMMKLNRVTSVQYADNVFKLNVAYFLDTIKIKRLVGNKSTTYQAQSTNNDTLYIYSELGNSRYSFFEEYKKRTTPAFTIDYSHMLYIHDFKEHEMDLKLHYLGLINFLNLKKFTEPTLIKIE